MSGRAAKAVRRALAFTRRFLAQDPRRQERPPDADALGEVYLLLREGHAPLGPVRRMLARAASALLGRPAPRPSGGLNRRMRRHGGRRG